MVSLKTRHDTRIKTLKHPRMRRIKILGLAIVLGLSGCNGQSYCRYLPQYLSYDDLRSGVSWDAPRAIEDNGRIIVYQDYLLINEPRKGIHVFDNIAPEAPAPLGFITIPGNTDMFIRNDILYAKSYMDLVLLDVTDIHNIQEISRKKNAFEFYDPTPIKTAFARENEMNRSIPRAHRILGVVTGYDEHLTCN